MLRKRNRCGETKLAAEFSKANKIKGDQTDPEVFEKIAAYMRNHAPKE